MKRIDLNTCETTVILDFKRKKKFNVALKYRI